MQNCGQKAGSPVRHAPQRAISGRQLQFEGERVGYDDHSAADEGTDERASGRKKAKYSCGCRRLDRYRPRLLNYLIRPGLVRVTGVRTNRRGARTIPSVAIVIASCSVAERVQRRPMMVRHAGRRAWILLYGGCLTDGPVIPRRSFGHAADAGRLGCHVAVWHGAVRTWRHLRIGAVAVVEDRRAELGGALKMDALVAAAPADDKRPAKRVVSDRGRALPGSYGKTCWMPTGSGQRPFPCAPVIASMHTCRRRLDSGCNLLYTSVQQGPDMPRQCIDCVSTGCHSACLTAAASTGSGVLAQQ